MDRQTLLNEHATCKKRVITFSVLSGIALFFMIVIIIAFVATMINYAIDAGISGEIEVEEMPQKMLAAFLIFYLLLLLTIFALCGFTPFLIVNAVKMGKRSAALKRLDKEDKNNGPINV